MDIDISLSLKPYKEYAITNKTSIRVFDHTLNDSNYPWHFDDEDRKVVVLEANGWAFQFDDDIPFIMKDGQIINIPKGIIHRIIKGEGILKLKIFKI